MNGIAERVVRRITEATSVELLQSVLDENFGLILWNAIFIGDMSKTSWKMEKHITKGASEKHFKAPSFRLVQWFDVHPISAKDHQGSTNLARRCYQEYPSEMC